MKGKQVNKNLTFHARIDRGWWKILSQLRTDTGKGFKELIEDALINIYCIGKDGKPEIYNKPKNGQVKEDLILTRN